MPVVHPAARRHRHPEPWRHLSRGDTHAGADAHPDPDAHRPGFTLADGVQPPLRQLPDGPGPGAARDGDPRAIVVGEPDRFSLSLGLPRRHPGAQRDRDRFPVSVGHARRQRLPHPLSDPAGSVRAAVIGRQESNSVPLSGVIAARSSSRSTSGGWPGSSTTAMCSARRRPPMRTQSRRKVNASGLTRFHR